MPPDTSDIARRLRQTRADMIGTDDEEHYWDCQEAAAEIERLRLTDAERRVIESILIDPDFAPAYSAATLRGLLNRTEGGGK